MKHLLTIACALWFVAACSGISQFVYYEPQANGWELRSPGLGEPNDEVIFRGSNYAITVSAMTLSTNLKSVGPPLLPVVPVNGSNELASFYEPGTLSIYIHFILREQAKAEFSNIKLVRGDETIAVHTVYQLPISTLGNKKIVGTTQIVLAATEYERVHGQFPEYQLVYLWAGEKPNEFAVEIPVNAIRVNGESIPATIIHFTKKTASKYQQFP